MAMNSKFCPQADNKKHTKLLFTALGTTLHPALLQLSQAIKIIYILWKSRHKSPKTSGWLISAACLVVTFHDGLEGSHFFLPLPLDLVDGLLLGGLWHCGYGLDVLHFSVGFHQLCPQLAQVILGCLQHCILSFQVLCKDCTHLAWLMSSIWSVALVAMAKNRREWGEHWY